MNASACARKSWKKTASTATPRAEHSSRRLVPPARDRRAAGRVRRGPATRQEGAGGGRLQPLQAHRQRQRARRRGAGEEQHPADRADRLRQDAAGADPGAHPGRAVHHRRRHRPDRGRLRGRGRGEHPGATAAGRRLGHPAGRAGHRLHRRDRQDRAQERRQPVDHARRVGRGRAAGAAQDHRGHGRQRAAAGRAQAPEPGVRPARHAQHPVHLRRRLLGAGGGGRPAGRRQGPGRLHRPATTPSQPRKQRRRRCSSRSSPTTCSSTA